MAQTNEPDKRRLLGQIVVAVWIDTVGGGDALAVEVHAFCCNKHGKFVQDPSLVRREDLSIVANGAALAFEDAWRQTMPAQPESSSSPETSTSRTTSGRSNGRH